MKTPLFVLLLVFTVSPLLSQQEGTSYFTESAADYEDLFSAEEPLELTLKFDVDAFRESRYLDVYHDSEMTMVVNDDDQRSHPVQIKARKSIRREFCALPPMWVKMQQDAFPVSLVLPCKDADRYEPYVLREYLAYKLYNIITPLSYRVRLVKLSIIDTGKGNEVTGGWAFLQEPDELMARRLNSMMIEDDKLSMRTVNPEVMNSLSMFQYMIGNTDYSVTGRHNLKIMTSKEYGPTGFIPIPYEFDYSGLVNADYAIPSQALGTKSVRERYYLGLCHTEEVYKATMQELAKYELEIKAYIKDFEYLDNEEKDDMMDYLDTYFKASGESGFIDQNIALTCR